MAFLVTRILESVIEFGVDCRTLGDLKFWRRRDGRILYYSGNSVVVFKVFHKGKWCSLRCYTKEHPYLNQIYGECYYANELFIENSAHQGKWVDVVLQDWVEGVSLGEVVKRATLREDREVLSSMSRNFDMLAIQLLKSDWAHGDISGDNIILTSDGELQLIDFDTKYIPEFEGLPSFELGTAAFQSPQRTANDFNAHIDDYSIALISTSLAALALDPTLYRNYSTSEGILLHAQHICKKDMRSVLDIVYGRFSTRGLAARYRIAKMLATGDVRCEGLLQVLEYIYTQRDVDSTELEVDIKNGYCGYIDRDGELIIPYIFNEAFEFRESLAAVELNGKWFYINSNAEIMIKCEGCRAIKSFNDSKARVLKDNNWCYIDKTGKFIHI